MFVLESCCFVVSLRTGVKVFGFLTLVTSLIMCFFTAYDVALYAAYYKEAFGIEVTYMAIDILEQAMQIATSICLLVGVYQEKPKLLQPYMVSSIVVAISETFFIPSFIGRMYLIEKWLTAEWVVFGIITLVDDVYGLLVVYSYYCSLSNRI